MANDILKPTLLVSLTVKNVAEALEFYTQAFGAVELFRLPDPSGAVVHAEFMLGDSKLFISSEAPDWHASAMAEGELASCLFALPVENCNAAHEKAVAAGVRTLSEPQDQFWGIRSALVADPYGYRWNLNEFLEEVSPEEMAKRAQALFSQ